MTRVASDADATREHPSFGAGGAEPYARGLEAGSGRLRLSRAGQERERGSDVALQRFLAPPDDVDREVAGTLTGPVLDIGCGPGRMVAAMLQAGQPALGIDVSPAAVQIARSRGLPVLRRSVFDPMPRRHWRAALLMDGNIGIGGDPTALLSRVAELVQRAPHGRIVVEAHADPLHHQVFDAVVVDGDGHASSPFPWAEVGTTALHVCARAVDLVPVREWVDGGRAFAEYAAR